jgi:nitrite reductase/ring-hydroxylating ferredoxin subunit
MKWIEVTPDLLPEPNQNRTVKIDGKSVCLVHHEGKLHAISSRCPHAGAQLSSGWCEGQRIICPFHRHGFDLETGKGDPGQGNYIRIYPLKIEESKYYIGFKDQWFRRLF